MAKAAKKVKEEKVEEVVPVEETSPKVKEISEETTKIVEEVELMDITVTQKMVDEYPEFKENEIKAGDVIQVATTDEGDAKLTESAIIDTAIGIKIDETFEEVQLSNDASRWERYLKTMGLT